MANTEIVSFRAENHRQQRRIMERRLRGIQRRHPDARVVSVNASRRSALQWHPCKLDVTMVVEWVDAAAVGVAVPTSGMSGSVAGEPTGPSEPERSLKAPRWFAGLTTGQKILAVVLLWPILAPWWLWTNPQFTTKTKAVVTAVSVAVIAVMGAFGGTSEPAIASERTATTIPDSATEAGTCRKPSTVEYCTTKEAAITAGERFAAQSSMDPTGFCVRQNGEWEAADGGWNHYLPMTDGGCDKPTHEYHPVVPSTPTTSASYTRTTEPELVACPDALETLAKRPGWGNDGFVRGVDALYDPAMDWDGDGVSCE